MGTETLERPGAKAAPTSGDGDHDRFSHYVSKSAWERAYLWGESATALCGKKWIPHDNPDNYPVCPTCAARYKEFE